MKFVKEVMKLIEDKRYDDAFSRIKEILENEELSVNEHRSLVTIASNLQTAGLVR
jgi:hypothetical protein